ncbi:flagellar assembly protein FliH [Paenibacillus endophyticus]|uniref:Flagellar assembly protein FliH n=1 Tax=Paenibacillus endophyticus TaxID=1294268 RepID=A0A7W5G9X0_9BACL|nr:FliH/SctL family protein [Paenibacillus endophyticus]MBB3152111.1 flagellar assembly protein FliH [Paenibacillus endophyticus]
MSNLIKSSSVITLDQLKQLEWLHQRNFEIEETLSQEEEIELGPDEETINLRDQILNDAQLYAEERLQEAASESERLLSETEQQIEVWWLQKRTEDEAASELSKQKGYDLGYAEGSAQSEAELREVWEQKIAEASDVLKTAFDMREQIIQEAEPFLVELSCAIAEKIIGQQLTLAPDMAIELIRKSLSRRREQGVITLCVAPGQLAFVQAAREELHFAIDSQAELQILPDSTVKDNGCVIRSAFGSIDARIDTQLSEIKRELIHLAHHSSEERGHSDDSE